MAWPDASGEEPVILRGAAPLASAFQCNLASCSHPLVAEVETSLPRSLDDKRLCSPRGGNRVDPDFLDSLAYYLLKAFYC
jgi:hypothetical protein